MNSIYQNDFMGGIELVNTDDVLSLRISNVAYTLVLENSVFALFNYASLYVKKNRSFITILI